MTTNQQGLKLHHMHSVGLPILQAHHLYRGSYSLLPRHWPLAAPKATFQPPTPPTFMLSRWPIGANNLLWRDPPWAALLYRSLQNPGGFWRVLLAAGSWGSVLIISPHILPAPQIPGSTDSCQSPACLFVTRVTRARSRTGRPVTRRGLHTSATFQSLWFHMDSQF